VKADVRFEIDRLFRERKIEIAFPQQDIHIRSGFKEEKEVPPSEALPVSAGESGKADENL